MNQAPVHTSELNIDQDIVYICYHGGRSAQVARFLIQCAGFDVARVCNLRNGVHAQANQMDPQMAMYRLGKPPPGKAPFTRHRH